MDFSRGIAAMLKRAIQVSRITTPPIYAEGKESSEPCIWSLPVMIEQHRAY